MGRVRPRFWPVGGVECSLFRQKRPFSPRDCSESTFCRTPGCSNLAGLGERRSCDRDRRRSGRHSFNPVPALLRLCLPPLDRWDLPERGFPVVAVCGLPTKSEFASQWMHIGSATARRSSGFPRTSRRPSQRDSRRYRPAARHAHPVDTSTSHIGFRCVVRSTDRERLRSGEAQVVVTSARLREAAIGLTLAEHREWS